MLTTRLRQVRGTGRIGLVAAVASALAVIFVAILMNGAGGVRFTDVEHLELPLPSAPPAARPQSISQDPTASDAWSDLLLPAPADPALIEEGPFGPLPRIGADGRWPFLAYARPFDFQDPRPKIGILVLGLGLQSNLNEAALRLPAEISLQFSPYGTDLLRLFELARRAGHEVLLDLPMEPPDYPESDPGPHTLLAENSADENLKRLDWLLGRAPGYSAFAGGGTRFASSPQALPALDALAKRGLALIEIGAGELAATAASVGLPYAGTGAPIDTDPSVLAIDTALAALEAEALDAGSALGVAQGYPVSLERLRLWATTLESKGIVLAPASAVVIEKSGLSVDFRLHDQAALGSQD